MNCFLVLSLIMITCNYMEKCYYYSNAKLIDFNAHNDSSLATNFSNFKPSAVFLEDENPEGTFFTFPEKLNEKEKEDKEDVEDEEKELKDYEIENVDFQNENSKFRFVATPTIAEDTSERDFLNHLSRLYQVEYNDAQENSPNEETNPTVSVNPKAVYYWPDFNEYYYQENSPPQYLKTEESPQYINDDYAESSEDNNLSTDAKYDEYNQDNMYKNYYNYYYTENNLKSNDGRIPVGFNQRLSFVRNPRLIKKNACKQYLRFLKYAFEKLNESPDYGYDYLELGDSGSAKNSHYHNNRLSNPYEERVSTYDNMNPRQNTGFSPYRNSPFETTTVRNFPNTVTTPEPFMFYDDQETEISLRGPNRHTNIHIRFPTTERPIFEYTRTTNYDFGEATTLKYNPNYEEETKSPWGTILSNRNKHYSQPYHTSPAFPKTTPSYPGWNDNKLMTTPRIMNRILYFSTTEPSLKNQYYKDEDIDSADRQRFSDIFSGRTTIMDPSYRDFDNENRNKFVKAKSDENCNDKVLPCPDTVNITYPLNGYCDRYVSCESGRAIRKTCENGLHFNVVTKSCDLPHNSICSYMCPEENGFYGIPGDCGGYFLCTNSVAEYRMCPPKMHWDIERRSCTFLDMSTCPMKCTNLNEVKQYDGDCQAYIICLGGRPFYHKCPPNTKFDKGIFTCVPEDLSKCQNDPRLLTKNLRTNGMCRDIQVKYGSKVWCDFLGKKKDEKK